MRILFILLIQLILFAYAIHMDVKHIPMVVADQSMDQASRSYLDDLVRSDYFDNVLNVSSHHRVLQHSIPAPAFRGPCR